MSFTLKTWEPLGIIFEPSGSVIDFCNWVSTYDDFPMFSTSPGEQSYQIYQETSRNPGIPGIPGIPGLLSAAMYVPDTGLGKWLEIRPGIPGIP